MPSIQKRKTRQSKRQTSKKLSSKRIKLIKSKKLSLKSKKLISKRLKPIKSKKQPKRSRTFKMFNDEEDNNNVFRMLNITRHVSRLKGLDKKRRLSEMEGKKQLLIENMQQIEKAMINMDDVVSKKKLKS